MTNKALHILLVEDNKGDVILTLNIFQDLLMNNSVSVVDDGEQAIRYLNNKEEFAKAVMPDLILLDINMPKVDGKEVLRYINQHHHFFDGC
jgi:CheY-like chemotaxis protein